ncbi:MAG: hypothetical protein ACLFTI_04920 [Anaerolineales bacterium]
MVHSRRALNLSLALTAAWLALALCHAAIRAGSPLPPDTFAAPCSEWVQVNDGAFGMDTGGDSNYSSEEGFEVVVFDRQLYVGMEADNDYGARIWRTKSGVRVAAAQADWEEVAADAEGLPFGNTLVIQNDHIDSLAVFEGVLYASTANGGPSTYGTLVYSSAAGASNSWTQVISSGFGDVHNTNFKDLQVFQGWLCGGTQNKQTGAQVWCTEDGATWVQKNHGGFGATVNDTRTFEIWSGYVYSDALYFGAQTEDDEDGGDRGTLYRATDLTPSQPTWTRLFTGPVKSRRVDILGDLDGFLYIATDGEGAGIHIYRSATGDAGTWSQVNATGMDDDANNAGAVVDGAAVYNGALYVAVTNLTTGVEVWRTTGVTQSGGLVDWTQVGADGLGDADNGYSELIPFNGYLYAWTSNYATGQQVRRANCPIGQRRAITEPGAYAFPGVGATITLTAGSLDAITVSVLPGAYPTAQPTDTALPRTYRITAEPATAAFTADLTLAYDPAELVAVDVASDTLLLARWDSGAWVPCPEGQRARNPAAHTVACREVTTFSTWIIAGAEEIPSGVSLARAEAACSPWGLLLMGIALLTSVQFWRRRGMIYQLPRSISTKPS